MSDDLSVGVVVKRRDVSDLAAAIVASCTTDTTPLPRRLYAINDDTRGAA